MENKGPMTLNDARRDDGDEPEYEVQKKATKKETFEYEKELKKIFDKHDKGKLPKEEDPDELIDYSSDLVEADLKRLFKQDAYEIVSTFIRMFADGNKNVLERRVALFQTMLDLNFAKYDHVKQGWLKNSGVLFNLFRNCATPICPWWPSTSPRSWPWSTRPTPSSSRTGRSRLTTRRSRTTLRPSSTDSRTSWLGPSLPRRDL